MEFSTPRDDVKFDIPDDWWNFSEVASYDFSCGSGYYAPASQEFTLVEITVVAPPVRTTIGLTFRKYKLLPVLFAFTSPECSLPLVEVSESDVPSPYKYRVTNGYHRYYASVAVGYFKLPVNIR